MSETQYKKLRGVYRPANFNLKEKFKRYLIQDEDFQSKYYQSYNTKEERAEAFLSRDFNKNLNRAYLLIGELFNPIVYGTLSKERTNSNETLFEAMQMEIGITKDDVNRFMNRSSEIQKIWMSHKYRMIIIRFLIAEKIIQRDGIWFSVFSNAEGQKSLGYRIHPRLYSKGVKWVKRELRMDSLLYKNYTENNYSKAYLNSYPRQYKGIYNHLQNFEINFESIPEDLKKKYEASIEFAMMNPDFFHVAHAGRIYSTFTNLPSELRQFIVYKPNPDMKFTYIDVRNCTYWALSVDMSIQYFEDKKELLNSVSTLVRKIEPYIKDLIPDFVTWIKDSDYKPLAEAIEEKAKVNKSTVIKLFESGVPHDVLIFMLLSITGNLYEVLVAVFGLDESERDKLKKALNKLVNLPSGQLFDDNSELKKFLVEYFHNVYNQIDRISTQNPKNFSYRMNSYETELIIREFGGYLLEQETPFITIHDGVMIPEYENEAEVDFLKIILNNMSKKLFGLPIPIKVEDL